MCPCPGSPTQRCGLGTSRGLTEGHLESSPSARPWLGSSKVPSAQLHARPGTQGFSLKALAQGLSWAGLRARPARPSELTEDRKRASPSPCLPLALHGQGWRMWVRV